MHEFAEEYVSNLKPREQRYDTRLGDDFYVATFPNGVKTWLYVYKVNDFTRKQTLGVYPEMPLPVALEALYSARRTRAVEADLADKGLDSGQVRDAENSPIDLTARPFMKKTRMPSGLDRKFLAGVASGMVVCMMAGIAIWQFSLRQATSDAPMLAAVADPVPPAIPVNPPENLPPPRNDYPEDMDPPELPQPELPELADTVGPALAAAAVAGEAGEPGATEELGASQLALMQMQEELAGTLAWSQLTSAIRDGEPVDHLGWIVELERDSRRVFFFVRVRGMSGKNVRYVWRYKGKVLKEDSVTVGTGWHSPAFSGITLTAERLGRWQVEVIGPDGSSLGVEQFETRLSDAQMLSAR